VRLHLKHREIDCLTWTRLLHCWYPIYHSHGLAISIALRWKGGRCWSYLYLLLFLKMCRVCVEVTFTYYFSWKCVESVLKLLYFFLKMCRVGVEVTFTYYFSWKYVGSVLKLLTLFTFPENVSVQCWSYFNLLLFLKMCRVGLLTLILTNLSHDLPKVCVHVNFPLFQRCEDNSSYTNRLVG
jgi:hypothetical protein